MIRLDIKVQPHAKIESFEFSENQELKLKVKALAVDGRANERVIEILSQALDLAKSNIQLIRGHKNRLKTFEIQTEDTTEAIREKLLQARWK